MIEFGETLRRAREAKGLSVRQVAQSTHLLVQQVEALEREDFSRIAAPIYGRGFVKLYCEAVGIEPKPLIDEFMDIYTGNRPPTIRMRNVDPAPASNTYNEKPHPLIDDLFAEQPEPTQNQEAVLPPQPSLFDQGIVSDIPTPAQNTTETPSAQPNDDLFSFQLESETVADTTNNNWLDNSYRETGTHSGIARTQGPSRYSTLHPIEQKLLKFKIPPIALKIAILVGGAILVLWLLISGISALFSSPENPQENSEAAKPGQSQRIERTIMKIDPLYAD